MSADTSAATPRALVALGASVVALVIAVALARPDEVTESRTAIAQGVTDFPGQGEGPHDIRIHGVGSAEEAIDALRIRLDGYRRRVERATAQAGTTGSAVPAMMAAADTRSLERIETTIDRICAQLVRDGVVYAGC
jgi:predicted phage tail protein